MQVRCVRPFGHHAVGDLAEVPDGATADPEHWEPVAPVTVAVKVTGAGEALAKLGELKAKASELAPVIPAKEGM